MMLWNFAEQTRISLNSVGATEPVRGVHVQQDRPRRIRFPATVAEAAWCSLLRESKRVLHACRVSESSSPTGAAALRELTHAAAGDAYGPWSAGVRYVPFAGERMAEPAIEHPIISLLDALPPDVADHYSSIDKILLPGGETRVPEGEAPDAAFDSILGDRREYIRYLRRPEVQALWCLVPAEEALATVSLAAVTKKSGNQLRKIVMCVPMNRRSRTPSEIMNAEVEYGLLGGAALGQVECHQCPLAVRTLDESNAFTAVRTPETWWRYMCAPVVRAGELSDSWVAGRWPRSQKLRPAYTRLGMGSTQAAYLLMAINLHHIGKILLANGRRAHTYLLNAVKERFPRPQLHRGAIAVYVHIDDVGVMATLPSVAEAVREELAAGLRQLGFVVTTDNPTDVGRYVGYRPVSMPPRWEPSTEKSGLLVRSIDELLTSGAKSVDAVHTALSVFMWMAQLWRPAMSMADKTFSFCRRNEHRFMWLPLVIRRELKLMRAALVFTFAPLDRKRAPVVAAQDAACPRPQDVVTDTIPYGAFCLSMAAPPVDEIGAVLRQVDGIGRSALIPDAIGSTMRRNGLLPELKIIARTVVPLRWCDGTVVWELFLSRPWRYGLGIEAGELRAGLTWSRLLAGSGVARGYEVLDLGDNQGVVCQFATGRSSRSPLNVLLRRHAAYEAVGGFRMRCAWVPTHRQPSDAGTRADDHGWLYQGIALWKSITLLIAVGWGCRLFPGLERPRRRLTAYE